TGTLTPEIYTLSLHDALPILRDALPVGVGVDLAGNRQRRILLRALVDELAVAGRAASFRGAAAWNPDQSEVVFHLHDAGEIQLQDRKSTRLNSSHVAISYAVF